MPTAIFISLSILLQIYLLIAQDIEISKTQKFTIRSEIRKSSFRDY